MDGAFDKYDSLIFTARKVVTNVGYQAETVIYGLNEGIEEIKSTNKQLKRTLRAISDNPTGVFLSEPPPKEK